MVLNSTKPRGATEEPDKVLASPARWSVIGLVGLLVVAGVAIALGGAFAPLGDGESRSVAAILAGVQLAVVGVAGMVVLWAPSRRRPLPPAASNGDGVELPVRVSFRVARVVALLVVASFGLTLLALADETVGRVLGVLVVIVGVAFAVLATRHSGGITLDPAGIRVPGGVTPGKHVEWREVTEVAVTGGWQPMLVVTWRGPGMSVCRILGQAWPPSVLVEVVEFYRTRAKDRAALTDPAALDQFRR